MTGYRYRDLEIDPFLKAIAAAPADDLPRLVFADYSEESGGRDAIARAHYIRMSCELAKYSINGCIRDRPYHPADDPGIYEIFPYPRCRCRLCSLKRKADKLLAKHSTEWLLGEFPELAPAYEEAAKSYPMANMLPEFHWMFNIQSPANWHRGFVTRLNLYLSAFLRFGRGIARRTPITEWKLSDRTPEEQRSDQYGRCFEWVHFDPERGCPLSDPQVLPSRLFDRLPKVKPKPLSNVFLKFHSAIYKTAEDANAALSAACALMLAESKE